MLAYDMNIVERGIRGLFAREFITRQRKAKYTRFCTVIDSDKKTEKFNAISTLPQMQEVTDERVLSGFSEYTYELTNKIYATGIKVPRSLFEFDQTGQLRTLVQSMGARVSNFPDKLAFTTLATNGTGYDGIALLSQSHNLGDGVSQSNDIAGLIDESDLLGGSKQNRDDTIARTQLSIRAGKSKFLEFNDDRGEPWHDDIEPESLIAICHPDAEFFFRTALEAAIVSDTGNAMAKAIGGVITTPYTSIFKDSQAVMTRGTFYLVKIDGPIQPLLYQRFAPKVNFPDAIPEADHGVLQALSALEVQTVMRTGSNIDTHTFFNDEFLFGARGIYSCGYGMWQNIIRVRSADWT